MYLFFIGVNLKTFQFGLSLIEPFHSTLYTLK